MRQKGRRKDIERAFGAMQAWFKVFRYADHSWDKDDIIESSYACIIIHNILVRMNEAGNFTKDIEQQNGNLDIIREMHAGKKGLVMQRAMEWEQIDFGTAQGKSDMNTGERVEEMFLHEATLTSYELHKSLKKDVMDKSALTTDTG